jgi:hypothetical protein
MSDQEKDEFAAALISDKSFKERRKDLNGNIIYNSEEVQSKFSQKSMATYEKQDAKEESFA